MISQIYVQEQRAETMDAEAKRLGAMMKRRDLIRAGVLTGAAAALRPPQSEGGRGNAVAEDRIGNPRRGGDAAVAFY